LSAYTTDIEASGLLDDSTIDYTQSPYRLKETFQMHCVVFENQETGEIVAFHDGDKYIFDGRSYEEKDEKYTYVLKEYVPQEYTHFPLKDLKDFIHNEGRFKDDPKYKVTKIVGHNILNYDLLALKLYYKLPYSVKYNTWGKSNIKIVDTMILSKVLNPDRFGGHSLGEISKKAGGDVKLDFRKEIPIEDRFKTFAADMLYYCIYDNKANTAVYKYLMEEWGDYSKWQGPFDLEQRVADIITRQEHRGFAFNMKQAEHNIKDLDQKMEERRARAEPILPEKPATKGYLKDFIPPKLQFKKDGSPTSNILKFAAKHNGELHDDGNGGYILKALGEEFTLPLTPDVPICNPNVPATLNDTTHIKNWLVGLGWSPSEYKDKDLTLKSGTKIKKNEEQLEKGIKDYVEQTLNSNFCADRCEHLDCTPDTLEITIRARIAKGKSKGKDRGLKVLTNPSFTKGQDKEICPNLEALGEKFPFATDIVEYLTFKHRRNSILGGGVDWDDPDEEIDKGYMAAVRSDGRIPTPAATCDAACVVADTLIVTDNGLQKVIDIAIGDLVLTHTGQYRAVVDRVCNGIKEVFKVCDDSGLELTCTKNHPFLTKEGWKRADELVVGEEILAYQEKETWSQVKNFSKYYISSWGRILTEEGNYLSTLRRKELWSRADCDFILDDGSKLRTGIGRLVLMAFVGQPKEGQECCHKDGNPCNNYVGNLYWGTSKENSADARLHGRSLRSGRNRDNAVLSEEKVNEIREYFLYHGYNRGDDQRIAKVYGCSRQLIGDIRNGRRWREDLNTQNIYREAFKVNKITSVESMGLAPTFDVTVETDHSYVANGFVTHNTSRMKHRLVANIPRVTSLYGEEMRSLFGVESPRYFQIGYDFDSLEARIESHYCWRYEKDPHEYCNALLLEKPYDVHSMMAKRITETIGRKFERGPAKSVKYGVTYGAQAAKVAKTIGSDLYTGELVFTAFWDAAAPLARLKERLHDFWVSTGKTYILGIDGRKVPTRSAHAILNSLFQSGGVICAKRAMVIYDDYLEAEGLLCDFFVDDWKNCSFSQQMIAYHDEAQLEVTRDLVTFRWFKPEEIGLTETEDKEEQKKIEKAAKAQAEAMLKDIETSEGRRWANLHESPRGGYYSAYSRAGELASMAVYEAGRYYGLNVDLTAGYDVGRSWCECH